MRMAEALLVVDKLDAFYGDFQALFGVSLNVDRGEVAAVIGANGAGKSTLLKSIVGWLPARRDAVKFGGAAIGGWPANRVVAAGIALVPEGRRLFASLNVEENLIIGGQVKRKGPWDLARVYKLFPVLREKRLQPGTSLSGGQQQMVAIGRALMSNPDLLLCDELSLGLAPIVVKEIYAQMTDITAEGLAVVIVEQDIGQALRMASHICCLQVGRVALEGPAAGLSRETIGAAYFGA
jgi:branched-chain amino acid transport system ATP-binding protein